MTGTYVSAEVPFHKLGNRRFLTSKQLREDPELEAFVERFSNCFDYDYTLSIWWYDPGDK